MIDDIIFATYSQIYMDIATGSPGGTILAYSLDGSNYDYTQGSGSGEINYAYII